MSEHCSLLIQSSGYVFNSTVQDENVTEDIPMIFNVYWSAENKSLYTWIFSGRSMFLEKRTQIDTKDSK
jgi:hypothetical protein